MKMKVTLLILAWVSLATAFIAPLPVTRPLRPPCSRAVPFDTLEIATASVPSITFADATVVPFIDDTAVVGFLAVAFPVAIVVLTIFVPRAR